jgi:hypothetical protein
MKGGGMQYPSWLNKPPWMHIGASCILVFLMLFDFKVAFHRTALQGVLGLSVANSEARASDPYASAYGSKFVAVRSDIWSCFRIRENVHVNFGVVTIPDRCQERYMVVVQTEACQKNRSETLECSIGTWRWVPNPPCGSDSPTGWYLPPC